MPGGLKSMGLQRVRHDRATEHQDYIAHQPLFVGFSRQEYWRELPFPSPGNLPDPGIELMSPASAGRFFTAEPPGKLLPFPNPISPVSFPASFSPQALIPHVCGVPLSPLACTFLSTSPNLEAPERFLAATRKK